MLDIISKDVASNKLAYTVHCARLRRERNSQRQCDVVGLIAAVALYGLYKMITGV